MTTYTRGASASFTVEHLLPDGTPVTPASQHADILAPDDTVMAGPLTPTLVSPGVYEVAWAVPNDAVFGVWRVRWTAVVDGGTRVAFESFTVAASSVLPPASDVGTDALCVAWVGSDALPCDLAGFSDQQISNAVMAASETLWALSGRRFGGCVVEVWPCLPSAAQQGWTEFRGSGWSPVRSGGQWINVCGSGGGCGPVEAVRLPPLEAVDVTAVTVDGVVLTLEAWEVQRVNGHARLVRLDGGLWPIENDFGTGPGSWSITVSYGGPIPASGVQAAGVLACEFLKAAVGAPCDLPSRVSTISRLGESLTFLDPMEFLTDGRTGIYLVDLFLAAVNPAQLATGPAMWSPDTPQWVTK